MSSQTEFDNTVQTVKDSLSGIAGYMNDLKRLSVPEEGPLDDDIAEAMRDKIKAVREGIDTLNRARIEMASTWLRTGQSRSELSELSGIPLPTIRRMSETIERESSTED